MPNLIRSPRAGFLTCLAVFVMSTSAGCSSTALRMASGTPTALSPGQQAVLPDNATLTYLSVAADSRCPPQVQCIRAGDADVVFEHRPVGGNAQRLTLNLPEAPSAPIGTFTLRILALEFGDQPKATVRVDPTSP